MNCLIEHTHMHIAYKEHNTNGCRNGGQGKQGTTREVPVPLPLLPTSTALFNFAEQQMGRRVREEIRRMADQTIDMS